MKIAIECDSPLLQKSLELFLKKYIVDIDSCEFIVSDHVINNGKVYFLISQDKNARLKVPFTKDKLMGTLATFYKHVLKEEEQKVKELELVALIEKLNRAHEKQIEKLMRDFYEKKY